VPSSSIKKLSRLTSFRPFSLEELSKHIDPALLKDLGTIQTDPFKRTHLTVVFWDLSGFSSLVKDLHDFPEAIIYTLKVYFETAIKIILKYRGVLDKFIGDGILAYFGHKNEKEKGNPRQVILAVIEFRNKFPHIKDKIIKACSSYGKDASKINLRCAMHNGLTYIHYFSSETRNSINFIGDPINLASRFENLANDGEIIISEEIRAMTSGKFEFEKIKIEDRLNDKCFAGKIKSFPEIDIVYNVIGPVHGNMSSGSLRYVGCKNCQHLGKEHLFAKGDKGNHRCLICLCGRFS
jgi:class 3 adenylate cyclase